MIASVITDYKASKAEIVDVDFAEFQCNPGNLRIAFLGHPKSSSWNCSITKQASEVSKW